MSPMADEQKWVSVQMHLCCSCAVCASSVVAVAGQQMTCPLYLVKTSDDIDCLLKEESVCMIQTAFHPLPHQREGRAASESSPIWFQVYSVCLMLISSE